MGKGSLKNRGLKKGVVIVILFILGLILMPLGTIGWIAYVPLFLIGLYNLRDKKK
jgi:hypothetical protein